MAKPVVDISAFGTAELSKQLASFDARIQRKVVRQAMRKSAGRLKDHTLVNLSGTVVKEDTGRLINAIEAKKIGSIRSRRGIILGWSLPTKAELGIEDESYYPFAIEYGYTRTKRAPVVVPAKAPIRRAVNSHTKEEHEIMGRDIGKGVDREAKTHFAKVKGPR